MFGFADPQFEKCVDNLIFVFFKNAKKNQTQLFVVKTSPNISFQ
jgi:hypothetical protein